MKEKEGKGIIKNNNNYIDLLCQRINSNLKQEVRDAQR
jgi:hypothetical protein